MLGRGTLGGKTAVRVFLLCTLVATAVFYAIARGTAALLTPKDGTQQTLMHRSGHQRACSFRAPLHRPPFFSRAARLWQAEPSRDSIFHWCVFPVQHCLAKRDLRSGTFRRLYPPPMRSETAKFPKCYNPPPYETIISFWYLDGFPKGCMGTPTQP